jgi:hypothetical protein
MAAADGTVDVILEGRCGLTSWLFLRERIPREALVVEVALVEVWRNAAPAGEESRDERGVAAAEGDRETDTDCTPLEGPAEDNCCPRPEAEERMDWP